MSRFSNTPSGESPKSETANFDNYWLRLKAVPIDINSVIVQLNLERSKRQEQLHDSEITPQAAQKIKEELVIFPQLVETVEKLGEEKQGNVLLGDLTELKVQKKFGELTLDSPLWSCLLLLLFAAQESAEDNAENVGVDIQAMHLAVIEDRAWVKLANQARAAIKKIRGNPQTEKSQSLSGQLPVELVTEVYIADQIAKRLFGPSWKSHTFNV